MPWNLCKELINPIFLLRIPLTLLQFGESWRNPGDPCFGENAMKGAKEEGKKTEKEGMEVGLKTDMATKSRPHFLGTISLQSNPIRHDQRKDQQLKHIISHLASLEGLRRGPDT